jgi:hypothetical protein
VRSACRDFLRNTGGDDFDGDAYRAYVGMCLRPRREKNGWHFTATCRNVLGGNPYVNKNNLRFDFRKSRAIENAVWQRYAGLRIDEHAAIEAFVDERGWSVGCV